MRRLAPRKNTRVFSIARTWHGMVGVLKVRAWGVTAVVAVEVQLLDLPPHHAHLGGAESGVRKKNTRTL